MLENDKQIKFILYARKSTEDDGRQVQSIENQIDKLKDLAHQLGLKVTSVLTEAKSAKKPDNRPVFDEMLNRIEQSEADGILCWEVNRLSRNPIDSGKISWLLQQSKIKLIKTYTREYRPEDNVIIFNVDSGQANQYIIDLRKDVKRGIEKKLQKGWSPTQAPLGYLNSKIKERGENDISPDPDRYALVRKMWDLMLTGKYNPTQIVEIANKDWGFKTKKTKRGGGDGLSRSAIYNLFTNLFYAGVIEYDGQQYQGSHKQMITLQEYDHVQLLLGKKGKPRPKVRRFPFTGIIRCGECGCLVTAETKEKILKRTGERKEYTYYHCTGQKKDYKCSQTKVIKAEDLEAQIKAEINKFTILPEFRKLALEIINRTNEKEVHTRQNILEMQTKALVDTQNRIDKLLEMKLKEQITDDEYNSKRATLKNEITQLEQKIRGTRERADKWEESLKRVFNFAADARDAFINGDYETKKEILITLGSNFSLLDGKLSLEGCSWLEPIKKDYPAVEKDLLTLELREMLTNTEHSTALDELYLVLHQRKEIKRN